MKEYAVVGENKRYLVYSKEPKPEYTEWIGDHIIVINHEGNRLVLPKEKIKRYEYQGMKIEPLDKVVWELTGEEYIVDEVEPNGVLVYQDKHSGFTWLHYNEITDVEKHEEKTLEERVDKIEEELETVVNAYKNYFTV